MSITHPTTRLAPEYVLLGLLFQNPCHGYELHMQLRGEFGHIWHVSQSQTYNILKRLEKQGYISSTSVEQDKLPPRQLLQLTETGIQRFCEWLETPTKCSVHAIRVEFITRLYFIQRLKPQMIQETIQDQSSEVQLGLARLIEIRADLPGDQMINQIALDLRLKLLSSILSWLDECQKTFEYIQS